MGSDWLDIVGHVSRCFIPMHWVKSTVQVPQSYDKRNSNSWQSIMHILLFQSEHLPCVSAFTIHWQLMYMGAICLLQAHDIREWQARTWRYVRFGQMWVLSTPFFVIYNLHRAHSKWMFLAAQPIVNWIDSSRRTLLTQRLQIIFHFWLERTSSAILWIDSSSNISPK